MNTKKILLLVSLISILSFTACSKSDKEPVVEAEAKTMTESTTTVKPTETKVEEMADELVEEVSADLSSAESYVAGYVSGALNSLKDAGDCTVTRDSVSGVLTGYQSGDLSDTEAVAQVKELMSGAEACMK